MRFVLALLSLNALSSIANASSEKGTSQSSALTPSIIAADKGPRTAAELLGVSLPIATGSTVMAFNFDVMRKVSASKNMGPVLRRIWPFSHFFGALSVDPVLSLDWVVFASQSVNDVDNAFIVVRHHIPARVVSESCEKMSGSMVSATPSAKVHVWRSGRHSFLQLDPNILVIAPWTTDNTALEALAKVKYPKTLPNSGEAIRGVLQPDRWLHQQGLDAKKPILLRLAPTAKGGGVATFQTECAGSTDCAALRTQIEDWLAQLGSLTALASLVVPTSAQTALLNVTNGAVVRHSDSLVEARIEGTKADAETFVNVLDDELFSRQP